MDLQPSERALRGIVISIAESSSGGEDLDSGLVTYTQLGAAAKKLGFPWTYPMVTKPFRGLGSALGKISMYEHSLGRPLITALVVQEDGRRPGPGFWLHAESLAAINVGADREKFWQAEVERVTHFWREAKTDPYRVHDAAASRALELLRLIRRDL